MTSIVQTEIRVNAAFRSLALLCTLLPSTLLAGTDDLLNGIDTYNHMGKDYYLVAHYTDRSCLTAEQCEQAKTPARFQLKITTERWTSHSFSLVWRRELASNNDSQLDNVNLQALLDFIRIAETQLTRGDTIDIAFDGSDTTIAVNKVFAVRAEGKELFNYIARVWLGPVPPSREFKQNMLAGHQGAHNAQVLNRFNELSTPPARMSLLDTWHAEKESVDEAPPQKLKSTSSSDAAPQKIKHSKSQNVVAPTEQNSTVSREQQLAALEWHIHNAIYQAVIYPASEKALGRQGKATISFTLNAALELAGIQSVSSEPRDTEAFSEALKMAIQQSQPFSYPPGVKTEVTTLISTYEHYFTLDSPSSPPPKPLGISAATFEQLLYGETRQSIAPNGIDSEVLRAHIDSYISYPFWAKRFGIEGTVEAIITLTGEGSLADITILEGVEHKSLTKAVKAAIEKAAPFPIQSTDGALISFDYYHAFKL